MSRCRVAVSGVVRQWDGGERTGVNAAYLRSVVDADGVPAILSPVIGAPHAARALEGFDALVLTGGEDVDPSYYAEAPSPRLGTVDPARDLFELALFAAARQRGLPILGICRGIQLINVALGGTLWQDLASERPESVKHEHDAVPRTTRTHAVTVAPGSRAHRALGVERLAVNSIHHQGIKELAAGLVASGWGEDGLIETVETADGDGGWLLAVQWHPEEMHAEPAAPDRGVFAALVAAARP